jgi:hypothetical protein
MARGKKRGGNEENMLQEEKDRRNMDFIVASFELEKRSLEKKITQLESQVAEYRHENDLLRSKCGDISQWMKCLIDYDISSLDEVERELYTRIPFRSCLRPWEALLSEVSDDAALPLIIRLLTLSFQMSLDDNHYPCIALKSPAQTLNCVFQQLHVFDSSTANQNLRSALATLLSLAFMSSQREKSLSDIDCLNLLLKNIAKKAVDDNSLDEHAVEKSLVGALIEHQATGFAVLRHLSHLCARLSADIATYVTKNHDRLESSFSNIETHEEPQSPSLACMCGSFSSAVKIVQECVGKLPSWIPSLLLEEEELQDIVSKILEMTRNCDVIEPLFINEAMEAKRTMSMMVACLQRVKYSLH